LIPAFAVLGLLVVVVVFLLPGWVETRAPANSAVGEPGVTQTASDSTSTTGKPAAAPATGKEASPFADALEAKARAEAQDLLAELLDVQENIIERGAEEWAPDAVADIAAQALAGDEHYRVREFESAITAYKSALAAALAIEQSLPERFDEQLRAATAAIEDRDADAAAAALELARRLEPAAAEIQGLQQRLAALPDVISALDAAATAESSADLETAVAALEQAAALDAEHEYVRGELSRLASALNQQRFNAAMSEGYAALDASEFSRAQQRFERAGKLQSGSSEAAAALQELAVARTVATLNRLQGEGERHLADEDWEGAIKSFEEALAIDGSLRFAREGLALARPRGILDKELQAILDKPERLVDNAVLSEARGTLARAAEVGDAGPRLQSQRQAVQDILEIASTPVPVSLRSDGLTEITVYKVARLGAIEERQLSLRPGQYTAVGTRRGYRDVRVVFKVSPSGTAPVYIACSEAI
jgi:tetratricopeptide (TPR) repeat protein